MRSQRLTDPQPASATRPARPGPAGPQPRVEAAQATHLVQFYTREAAMLDHAARFLRAGLGHGDTGVVVATPAHEEALRQRLGGAASRCRFLDADATMRSFLDGDRVDLARFEATVGEAVRAAAGSAGSGRVRAFGEMVALLCAQGRAPTAVELERAWNRLAVQVPLSLLCAYPTSLFQGPDAAPLDAVCAEHDQVDHDDAAAIRQDGAPGVRHWGLLDADALTQRVRQQAAVARIGHLALQRQGLEEFFARACREVADALGTDTCVLLERVPGDEWVQFRAGHGFSPGFAPRADATAGSHPHYILRSGKPVVYEDLARETRFRPSPMLLAEGIRGGLSVVVPTSHGAWGTVGTHTRRLHAFSQDDVNFLEAVAHVLGAAIERRNTEAELQRSRDHLEALVRERTQRLEHANRELDAFSSAVSHDLRGPVRAIAGFSALLAQRHAGRLDPHGRELLEEVRRAVARMGDLIEDLLDLSRADRALPSRGPVDLSAMAREILAAEAARQPARAVRFEVEPDLLVEGDADLLRMALENLLSNAWKFTARTPDPRISVSKRREGEDLVLCVQDNGAGFDMADAGRLFQPFQRLHRRSDYDGTGIGLATVRRIIERHGGRIWAQAKPGAGATFYFTLPGPQPDVPATAA